MFKASIVAMITAVSFCASAYAAEGEVNRRLERQKTRIEQGEQSGEVTPGEARHVERHDKNIHAQEKKDRQANGGTLTPKEKRHLNRELNRNSREIRRAKHNS